MNRLIIIPMICVFALTACGSKPASNAGTPAVNVLTTTTFLADITHNIAGDRVNVQSLLPAGADPHSYEPVPTDVAKINQSKLLIVNGLEYEHFLDPLLKNAGGQHTIVTASDGLKPNTMEDEEKAGQMVDDPHMWMDPTRVVTYVENIRKGLTNLDPGGAATYQSNADAYVAKLNNLDVWIKDQVSQIPADKRLLVTNHDALGYFAARYGFTIIGAVLPSVSSDASTSAGQMAKLIEQIKSSGAPAIFLDSVENPALAKQIADETGVKIIEDLHVESLTEGSPAGTYLDMMQYNVTRIVDALK
jgi:ABC-type Zn uptake system ZnuABC Zn-binding protein ZnuA